MAFLSRRIATAPSLSPRASAEAREAVGQGQQGTARQRQQCKVGAGTFFGQMLHLLHLSVKTLQQRLQVERVAGRVPHATICRVLIRFCRGLQPHTLPVGSSADASAFRSISCHSTTSCGGMGVSTASASAALLAATPWALPQLTATAASPRRAPVAHHNHTDVHRSKSDTGRTCAPAALGFGGGPGMRTSSIGSPCKHPAGETREHPAGETREHPVDRAPWRLSAAAFAAAVAAAGVPLGWQAARMHTCVQVYHQRRAFADQLGRSVVLLPAAVDQVNNGSFVLRTRKQRHTLSLPSMGITRLRACRRTRLAAAGEAHKDRGCPGRIDVLRSAARRQPRGDNRRAPQEHAGGPPPSWRWRAPFPSRRCCLRLSPAPPCPWPPCDAHAT
jgi:hypothetical protein